MRNDDYSLIWKALSDPTRRQILDLLRERPHTTGELAQAFQVSRFAVMKHIATLEQSGLITVRKQGRERWNTLNPVPLQLIYERWLRPYEMTWSRSLLQLKGLVEEQHAGGADAKQNPVDFVSTKFDISLLAPSGSVFDALTNNIAAWWGHPYIHSEAIDIVLEPVVGGRFYEIWRGKNTGALWARVSFIQHERALHLVGSLGMPEPVHGVALFDLQTQQNGTMLDFTFEAFGKIDQAAQAAYIAGWKDLLDVRLRAFVERNVRYGVARDGQGWFDNEIESEKQAPPV